MASCYARRFNSRATGIEPKVRLYLLVNRKSIDKVTRQYQPKQRTKAQLWPIRDRTEGSPVFTCQSKID